MRLSQITNYLIINEITLGVETVKNKLKVIKRKGITLVEVLVVIVILAILTVSLSAKIGSYFNKPHELRVLNDMTHIKDAVVLVDGIEGIANIGTLTDNQLPTEADAKTLADKLNEYIDHSLELKLPDLGEEPTAEGELRMAAKDPWKNQYRIKLIAEYAGRNGKLAGIELESYGPDGVNGGDDDMIMQIFVRDGSIAVHSENMPAGSEGLVN